MALYRAVTVLSYLLFAGPASAQTPPKPVPKPVPTVPADPDATPEEELEEILTLDKETKGPATVRRDFKMEVGLRARSLSIPDGLMGLYFFDARDEGWAWIEDRPKIRGVGLGAEFVVKTDVANGIFYFDYVDSGTGEGYWDDIEKNADVPDHMDGDYVKPHAGVGMLAVGANYAYEAHMVRIEQTDGYFGLSYLIGGGLGVGGLLGKIDRWGADQNGNPAYKLYLDGTEPEGKRIPRVYPMVDINTGLRFNFGDRAVLRLEGGVHTLLYWGATLGIMF